MVEVHRIHPDDAGQRLDRYLRKVLPGATLAHVFKLIRTGQVRVNGARARPGTRLVAGDEVKLAIAADLLARLGPSAAAPPTAGDLSVLHEDSDLVAIDKPAGLAVHPGSGRTHDHVIGRVHARYGTGSARAFRPAPAHRLDRETSGVLLIGRSAAGLRGLTRLLREGRVDKIYVTILEGVPAAAKGRIDLPLERVEGPRAKMVVAAGAAAAHTEFRVLARAAGVSLVEVRLHTGRTHQIRAHFAALGHPLYGDRRYGSGRGEGMYLHAREVAFPHPVSGKPLRIRAPLPAAFRRALRRLGLTPPSG